MWLSRGERHGAAESATASRAQLTVLPPRRYAEIKHYDEEIARVQGEKMQEMYKLNRAKQEMEMREAEIKRLAELREKTEEDNRLTQKGSDALQTGLKTSTEIQKSGAKEFEETSWKLQNNKKLIDTLILRTDKAKKDARM